MSLQGAQGEGDVGNARKKCVTQKKTSEGEEEERSQRHVQVISKGSKQTLVGVLLEQQSCSENSD